MLVSSVCFSYCRFIWTESWHRAWCSFIQS